MSSSWLLSLEYAHNFYPWHQINFKLAMAGIEKAFETRVHLSTLDGNFEIFGRGAIPTWTTNKNNNKQNTPPKPHIQHST
jgi:hypothetical protein